MSHVHVSLIKWSVDSFDSVRHTPVDIVNSDARSPVITSNFSEMPAMVVCGPAAIHTNAPSTATALDQVQHPAQASVPPNNTTASCSSRPTTPSPSAAFLSMIDAGAESPTYNAREMFTTPPPSATPKLEARPGVDYSFINMAVRPHSKKVYNIGTLMKLRDGPGVRRVTLRLKPEAIAENLFQHMGPNRARVPLRSRGIADVSNGSMHLRHRGLDHSLDSRYLDQPRRQPYAPPETSILQQHEGFVRFLKQHASPPHHRVTAGGRIVPAGPLSPPPMLNFASLNSLTRREQPSKTQDPKTIERTSVSHRVFQDPQVLMSSTLPLEDFSSNQSINPVVQHVAQANTIHGFIPNGNVAHEPPILMTQTRHSSAGMVPIGLLQDGSTVTSSNGEYYRTYWNGMNTVFEPLGIAPTLYHAQFHAASNRRIPYGQPYGQAVPPTSKPTACAPLANVTNRARTNNSQSRVSSSSQNQPTQSEDSMLSKQLQNLDRHLALNHFEINPVERASLVAKRKYLVEEIDRVRATKEPTKREIPIIGSAFPSRRKKSVQLQSDYHPHPATPVNDFPQQMQTSKDVAIKKYLSPSAQPFVPMSLQNVSSSNTILPEVFQSGYTPISEDRALDPQEVADLDATARNRGLNSFNDRDKLGQESEDQRYKPIDPNDPGMRVIRYDDIEYAARYLYNRTSEGKLYCTTVPEFQEAVRQVRQQATLHGCLGGQSKDPAYDAEQDIWWAICDRDPIPLPPKVPDYITNPHPWNWGDSHFNVRRPNACPEPPPMDARNSPRMQGWDLMVTEKAREMMDCSRSWYALHGLLPSVPFRDHFYDYFGNKIQLESIEEHHAADAEGFRSTGEKHDQLSSRSKGAIQESLQTTAGTTRSCSTDWTNTKPQRKLSATKAAIDSRSYKVLPDVETYINAQTPKVPTLSVRELSDSRKNQHSRPPFQPYIEDSLETPMREYTQSATEKAALKTENFASIYANTYYRRSPNAEAASSYRQTSPIVPRSVSKQAYANEPMAAENAVKKQANEGDNSSAMSYYSPSMKRCEQAVNHRTDPAGHTNDHMPGCFLADLHEGEKTAACRAGPKDHHIEDPPVAESKSQWGPEDEPDMSDPRHHWWADTYDPHWVIRDYKLNQARKAGAMRAPRVKIPAASTSQGPFLGYNAFAARCGSNSFDSDEVRCVNVQSSSQQGDHGILGDMLKSPRYSSALTISTPTPTRPLRQQRNEQYKSKQDLEKLSGKKENVSSSEVSNFGIIGSGRPASQHTSASASVLSANLTQYVRKAQSSLASSKYQARGYLPQYDGAGKAHASSIYHPHQQVRVSLPECSSYLFVPSSNNNPNSQRDSVHAANIGSGPSLPPISYMGSGPPPSTASNTIYQPSQPQASCIGSGTSLSSTPNASSRLPEPLINGNATSRRLKFRKEHVTGGLLPSTYGNESLHHTSSQDAYPNSEPPPTPSFGFPYIRSGRPFSTNYGDPYMSSGPLRAPSSGNPFVELGPPPSTLHVNSEIKPCPSSPSAYGEVARGQLVYPTFGFDGAGDTPPPKKPTSTGGKASGKANEHSDPDFDYKGVTTADYENRRADTNNSRHHSAVSNLFNDIGNKEFMKVMRNRGKSIEVAP